MAFKIGMNLLLWGTEINESLFPILEKIKDLGFDGVEIPIFDTDPTKWYSWRKKLDDLQLERVAVTINGPDFNFISSDAANRKATLERNKAAVDAAMILGSNLLTGPFHSSLGVFSGKPATDQEKQWAREGLWDLAEYADSMGITLGLEYLNRFESYLVSCSDELLALQQSVNHPACKLMFDTFHANIEEKNLADAIKKMGSELVHIQLSENDRSTLGKGHTPVKEIIEALLLVNYSGMLSIEAFSQKLAVANIWRPMFNSEEQLMSESLAFLKETINQTIK
jgi:D-psicose/D-tagatose/L-ribulose 3-epimerase